jgi:hypothetical protein
MATTQETYKQSIRECRQIYNNMTDREFINWYSKRYHIPYRAVMAVLQTQEAPRQRKKY